MAGLEHGLICQNVAGYLWMHVRQGGLGRVMSNDSFVEVGAEDVRGAGVLFYSYERLPKGKPVPAGFHTLPPDLVVEVRSPPDRWGEVFAKVGEYPTAGVRVVVFLDRRRPPRASTASTKSSRSSLTATRSPCPMCCPVFPFPSQASSREGPAPRPPRRTAVAVPPRRR